MKKNLHIFICIMLYAFISQAQQDPQYNLYQFNQMLINPAYAGAKDGLSAMAATRQQWVGISGSPKTNCLSIHAPVMKKNLGLGLTIMNDVLGPKNIVGISGNVAYILKLSQKLKLSFGINAGYNRYQFNFQKVQFYPGDEIPPAFYQNQNKGVLDMGAGLFLKSHNFFLGLSSSHLTSPSIYDYSQTDTTSIGKQEKFAYRVRAHVSLTAGYSYKIDENAIFAPTIMVKEVNGLVTADLNLNFFIYKKLWLGIFYRAGYGPGALFQYHINDNFRVAYSYDSGVKDQRRLGGSHEVLIGFDLAGKQKAKVASPRFL